MSKKVIINSCSSCNRVEDLVNQIKESIGNEAIIEHNQRPTHITRIYHSLVVQINGNSHSIQRDQLNLEYIRNLLN